MARYEAWPSDRRKPRLRIGPSDQGATVGYRHGRSGMTAGPIVPAETPKSPDVALPDGRQLLLAAMLVASSDDAIIGEDFNSAITTWNPAAQRLYGYTAEEVVGRSIAFLLPPDRLGE